MDASFKPKPGSSLIADQIRQLEQAETDPEIREVVQTAPPTARPATPGQRAASAAPAHARPRATARKAAAYEGRLAEIKAERAGAQAQQAITTETAPSATPTAGQTTKS